MGLAAGIIGLPNAGKSTIFNALTSGNAAAENYPFCTIEPNHGIAAIPDIRLETITRHISTARVVPSFLELVDIAGLVKGAAQGEGLGNQFLGHIKEVDALVIVIRCFESDDVVHVDGSVDSVRDASILETELIIKDLETVERSLARSAKAVQTGNRELAATVAVLEGVQTSLQQGIPARRILSSPDERGLVADLHLLTVKPVLYLANTGDGEPSAFERRQIGALAAYAEKGNDGFFRLRGRIEAEIMQLSKDEREEYYGMIGIPENGLAVLTRELYAVLGLHSFFTVNEKELHAWPVKRGSTAVEAAAEVHTDFAKGFIKADVYSVGALERYGSENSLRAAGKIRSEGREYVLRDGDILFFKVSH